MQLSKLEVFWEGYRMAWKANKDCNLVTIEL
jgi:hypothetical protein